MTSLEDYLKCPLPSESQIKDTVFSICNGKLIVAPKVNQFFSSSGDDDSKPSEDGEFNRNGQDDVYIEIFRENSVLPDQSTNEDYLIENISTAYEAFWKGGFEDCLQRRTCPKCSHAFFTPNQLFNHLKNSHSISNPEVCFVCFKVLLTNLEKQEHLEKDHYISSPFSTCEVCYKIFANESEKDLHRFQHTLTEKCKWCLVSFPCKFLLSAHLPQCLYLKKQHNCAICGCHFTSSHIMQLHSLRHSQKTCDLCCTKLYEDANISGDYHEIAYVKHLRAKHSDEEIQNVLLGLKKQDEEEEILDKLFMNQIQANISELNDIQLTADTNVPLEENCLKNSNMPLLKDGQNLKDDTNLISLDTIFQCSECSKNFDSKKKLMIHALDHQTPFFCDICKVAFQHRRSFKKHMRSHGVKIKPGLTRYKCMQCSVNCSTLSGLRTHVLTHTEHKPHLCDKCGITFRRLQALRMHEITIHHEKTSHTCPQCGLSSTSKKSLLRHTQCVHAGIRRFICGLCCARFLQNQDLRRHLKNVHKLDFPPLQCLLKKSNSQIHVIPLAESVNLADPFAAMLKSAVREEELKLENFCRQKHKNSAKHESQSELLKTESTADRLSLNILGDVASKAAPLVQKPCSLGSFQNCTTKFQESSTLLCGGGQNETLILTEYCNDLSVCKHSKLQPETTQAKNSSSSSSKHAFVYSVSSLQGCATTPYNLCVLPSQNALPPPDPGLPIINSDGFVCSILPGVHVGSTVSQSASLNVPNLGNSLICASGGSSTNLPVGCSNQYLDGESVLLSQNDSTRILNILSACNLDQPQLDLLGSSIPAMQGEYLSKESKDGAACTLNCGEGSLLVHSYHSTGDLKAGVTRKDSLSKSSFLSSIPYNSQSIPKGFVEISCQNAVSLISDVESSQPDKLLEPTSIAVQKRLPNPQPAEKPNKQERNSDLDAPESAFVTKKQTRKKNRFQKSNTKSVLVSCDTSSALSNQNPLVTVDKSNGTPQSEYLSNRVMSCPECGKVLSSPSNFKRHLKVHTGLKLHECQYCGKSFRYKHNLTVHFRCHTGERPYECTECSKKFRYLQEFKEHKQIHEISKLFSCLDCGQRFARQRDLKRHSLYHNTKNKPVCTICQKTFSRIDYLNIHIRSHKKLEEKEGLKCLSQSKEKISEVSPKQSLHKSSNKLCSDKISALKTSENLISLAFQAAEDGVEFMFLEESTPSENDTEKMKISPALTQDNTTNINVLE
ncbi:Oocyte zinc finger protein [Frankliniella fusca]|uniref:Oocyte zinc finger protein n=1 Tax=Frankliniella fusca TaxID=407009 RepID=A0AAE1HG41_9NEOP|nr:Oocyte zinc finger protein [Frankliniella fusca]